jgi:hypothetical protein
MRPADGSSQAEAIARVAGGAGYAALSLCMDTSSRRVAAPFLFDRVRFVKCPPVGW